MEESSFSSDSVCFTISHFLNSLKFDQHNLYNHIFFGGKSQDFSARMWIFLPAQGRFAQFLCRDIDNPAVPWYNKENPIMWWCPRERFIIRPFKIHISKSMKKFMRKTNISFRINRDFRDTIHRAVGKEYVIDHFEKYYHILKYLPILLYVLCYIHIYKIIV